MPIILLSPFNWEMKFEEAPLEHSTLKYDLSTVYTINLPLLTHTVFFPDPQKKGRKVCACANVCIFACLYSKTHILVVFPFPSQNYLNEDILLEVQTVPQTAVTSSFSDILMAPWWQIALLLKATQVLHFCYNIRAFIFAFYTSLEGKFPEESMRQDTTPWNDFLSWTGTN